jgi:hypothetical protein
LASLLETLMEILVLLESPTSSLLPSLYLLHMLEPNFGPLAFNLILRGLKNKIKRLKIYFDKKCDLSTCMKTRDYNVLLSFYPYL